MQILGAIGHVIRVLGQKTKMPIGGSNRFSSKTICRRINYRIWKRLECSHQPHLNCLNSYAYFFFLYLFLGTSATLRAGSFFVLSEKINGFSAKQRPNSL